MRGEAARLLRDRAEELTGKAVSDDIPVESSLFTLLSYTASTPPSPAFPSPSRRALVLALRHTDPGSALYPSLAPLLSSPSHASPPTSAAVASATAADASLSSHRLAALLRDLGYGCTASTAALTDVLAMQGQVSEHDVAMLVCMMLRTVDSLSPSPSTLSLSHILSLPATAVLAPPPSETWSASTFVAAVWALHPHLSWASVLAHLDHPAFIVPSPAALSLLLALHRHASPEPFPLPLFLSPKWAHAKGQLSLLRWLCPLRWSVFPVHVMPGQQRPDEAEEGDEGGQRLRGRLECPARGR